MTDALAAAWLDVLGALMADAAHASNNALNAASVNLSVLTTRLSSPKVAESSGEELAGRTAEFAVQAVTGLDSVSELVQSMVALARPLPAPPDPWRMVADIGRVATAGVPPGAIGVGIELREPEVTPDVGPAVRLVIAAGLRALLRAGQGGMVFWVGREIWLAVPAATDGAAPILSDNILRIVADAGLTVRAEGDVVRFSIPEVTVSQ